MHVSRLGWAALALAFALPLAVLSPLVAADKPSVQGKPVDKDADDKKADDKKVEGDLAKFQGKWNPKGEGGENTSYTFKGAKLKVDAPNRKYEITVTLDEKAKPEKSIDMKIDEAPEDAKGQTSKGIYKFDGEKIIICFRPQGERPEKFEMVGFEQILIELSKEKK